MIPWFEPKLWGKEQDYVSEAIRSEWISHGSFIEKFENEFAQSLNASHCLTTSNGTTALHLALLALGIGPGDEVIIPGYTFAAPLNMTLALGATPIVVDVDPKTWCISPQAIEKHISPRTKAIIPVHIYGNVAAMDEIMALAKAHQLVVIEDTAEAAFSKYNGQYAGTFGDIGCFSFQATKTLTMGEGGAIILRNPEIFAQATLYRNHGMQPTRRYWHEVIGHNFRLTNYQAAFGLAQLHALDEIIQAKKRVFEQYAALLGNQPGIALQTFQPEVDPVVWAIAIKVNACIDAKQLAARLYQKQIETRPGFEYFAHMPIYKDVFCHAPQSQQLSEGMISLPSSATLTHNEINTICQTLIEVLANEI